MTLIGIKSIVYDCTDSGRARDWEIYYYLFDMEKKNLIQPHIEAPPKENSFLRTRHLTMGTLVWDNTVSRGLLDKFTGHFSPLKKKSPVKSWNVNMEGCWMCDAWCFDSGIKTIGGVVCSRNRLTDVQSLPGTGRSTILFTSALLLYDAT